MSRGDGLFPVHTTCRCVSAEGPIHACPTQYTRAGINRQSDHHNGVRLYLQFVSYRMLGLPQEDLVSYLDLSCGYLQGGSLLVFVAGV